MEKLKKFAVRFWSAQSGQDVVESALLVGFVVVVSCAIVPGIIPEIKGVINKLAQTSFSTSAVRIVAGIMAVLFLALIIMKRKKGDPYDQ